MNEKYFFDSAFEFAKCNSTCLKVNVGAVFAVPNRRAKNGFKLYHSCNRSNDVEKNCQVLKECYKAKVTGIYESCEETRKYCSAIHAEVNLINLLKKENIEFDSGTIYVTRYPCFSCATQLINNGFKEVNYCGKQEISNEVKKLFEESDVNVKWFPEYDYEFDYEDINKSSNGEWWTLEAYEKCYNIVKDRKFPITIPSYNRPNPNILSNMLNNMNDEYNYPVFIFVRDSQKEEYENSINNKFVNIISFPDKYIGNAGASRRMILKWLYSNGYDCAFSFDDDLLNIQITERGFTDKGEPKSKVVSNTNIAKVLAMWQLAMEEATKKYNVVLSCGMPMGFSWKMEYCMREGSMLWFRGNLNQAVCFSTKKLIENGIIYKDNDKVGHEDIQLVAEINKKNIELGNNEMTTCVFPFLAYSVPPMSCENFGNFGSNMEDRFRNQQKLMINNWNGTSWINFREKRSLCQVIINWVKYRKEIGVENYIFDIFEGVDI